MKILAKKLLFEKNSIWSGIDIRILSGNLARIFNLPQAEGLLVQKAVISSPLGLMGILGGNCKATINGEEIILGGDIILSLNGMKFASDDQSLKKLSNHVKRLKPGEELEITILRNGNTIKLRSQ